MNISELQQIIETESGHRVCPYCGTPYQPYHARQKTCGSPECKKKSHYDYLRKRKDNMTPEELGAYKQRRAEINKRYMQKKRSAEKAEKDLEKLEAKAKEMQKHYEAFEDGLHYGERQMQRTLASVPKIDVSGFERKEKKKDEQSTPEQNTLHREP